MLFTKQAMMRMMRTAQTRVPGARGTSQKASTCAGVVPLIGSCTCNVRSDSNPDRLHKNVIVRTEEMAQEEEEEDEGIVTDNETDESRAKRKRTTQAKKKPPSEEEEMDADPTS